MEYHNTKDMPLIILCVTVCLVLSRSHRAREKFLYSSMLEVYELYMELYLYKNVDF